MNHYFKCSHPFCGGVVPGTLVCYACRSREADSDTRVGIIQFSKLPFCHVLGSPIVASDVGSEITYDLEKREMKIGKGDGARVYRQVQQKRCLESFTGRIVHVDWKNFYYMVRRHEGIIGRICFPLPKMAAATKVEGKPEASRTVASFLPEGELPSDFPQPPPPTPVESPLEDRYTDEEWNDQNVVTDPKSVTTDQKDQNPLDRPKTMNDEAIDQCYLKAKTFAEIKLFERSLSFIERALDIVERTDAGSRYDQVVADLKALRVRIQGEQRASEKPPPRPCDELCDEAARVISAPSHYAALGLAADAAQSAIRTAFLRLSLKFHPDKHAVADPNVLQLCTSAFKRINEAAAELSDVEQRRRYDQKTAQKRTAPPDDPGRGKKQKAEAPEWYAKFWPNDPLPKSGLLQCQIAAFCVRGLHRLASFMQGGGDTNFDWFGLCSRYAFDARRAGSGMLEGLLWRYGGPREYLEMVKSLQRDFADERYTRIRTHLSCLQVAVECYIEGEDVRPAAVPADASFEEACEAFVGGMRRLCLKMISIENQTADWAELVKKFPSDQASKLSFEAVGVDFCDRTLRDIMASSDSNPVREIARELCVILQTVDGAMRRARTVDAEEAARALRQELSAMIGHVVRLNFPAAKKISRILSPQIAVRSREVCLTHLVDYFCTKFTELAPARAYWETLVKEARASCLALSVLVKTLEVLQVEKVTLWPEMLIEKSGSAEFTARYESLLSKFADAAAFDGHICEKTMKHFCTLRSDLLMHIQEASGAE